MEIYPTQKRIFPSLYASSGDTAVDRLAFFHILERLKVRNFMPIGLVYYADLCTVL